MGVVIPWDQFIIKIRALSAHPLFSSKCVYVEVISFSKGLPSIFSTNTREKSSQHMLNFFLMFHWVLLLFIKMQLKKISPHRSFWQFLQMSAHQSVFILTNAQFHPSWCDYCLEWSHYTLDCMLSDKNPFSNQNNNSKEHNYFWLFCILKPTWKYYLAGFEFFFVKWLLVATFFVVLLS